MLRGEALCLQTDLMMKKTLVLLCIMLTTLVNAQPVDYGSMGVDELYTLARQKAFSGEREEARRLCMIALEKSPNYYEIAILMGRTYAWDGKRNEAREVYKAILIKEPQHLGAIIALAEVEIWDDKPLEAILILDRGLAVYPNNRELLVKKAKALLDAKREGEALMILNQVLDREPGCMECIELKQKIKSTRFKHTLTVNGAVDFFSSDYETMYYSAIQLGTVTKYGTFVGRVNYSNRFNQTGFQPEVDFYPGLWKGAYGYFNYGYTTSTLFARHRVGAEIFQSLPRSFETSLGLRYMDFGAGNTVNIYTASFGWYYKSYWLSARTFITPSNGSFSRSLNITTRKYFADANNYIGVTVGAGFSPDARRIQTNTGLEPGNSIYLLKSQKIECNWQKSIRYNIIFLLDAYYSHQELKVNKYVNVIGFTTGIRIRI
ncbi:MAG: YaiO family outer membrane beta-barrel protein [Bacteroidota bacterium]